MAIKSSDGIIFMNVATALIMADNGIVKSKLTSAQYTETPPPYRSPWQAQMQALCYGAKWVVIATFYKGTRLVLNLYDEADQEMQRQLIGAAEDFY